MAGLCEGGNELLGSLKAREIDKPKRHSPKKQITEGASLSKDTPLCLELNYFLSLDDCGKIRKSVFRT
ncbi:hypothetical protein ANN_24707 [Periplaneta americana]|uniref:Uncharacterized protein n=1 Tax=Periplaneta americana TaxID=6978 RepID=A0ABQ8RZC1_PERAM|nr:hypothetical protein ANN_24707 [Periplaneta americana]